MYFKDFTKGFLENFHNMNLKLEQNKHNYNHYIKHISESYIKSTKYTGICEITKEKYLCRTYFEPDKWQYRVYIETNTISDTVTEMCSGNHVIIEAFINHYADVITALSIEGIRKVPDVKLKEIPEFLEVQELLYYQEE